MLERTGWRRINLDELQKLIKNKEIIIIGVTGGVGCGKSTVLEFLYEQYGASIYKADEIGHKIMEKDMPAYKKIVEYFGTEILDKSACIDRKKLGAIAFNDEEKLEFLNSIIHPGVQDYIINGILAEYTNESHRLFVIEAALLIEAGYKNICTELWYIYADKDERIKRLISSRGYSREKCESIINNQLSEEIFRANSDFVVNNENDFNITKNQIEKHMIFCYNYTID